MSPARRAAEGKGRAARVVCAPDAFKESMSAREAAEAMVCGARRAADALGLQAEVVARPVSDGGAGMLEALARPGDQFRRVRVTGPLGEPADARLLLRRADGPSTPGLARAALVAAGVGAGSGVFVSLWSDPFVGMLAGLLVAAAVLLLHPLQRPAGAFASAALEMSSAAGLHLVPRDRRDPERTTTFGVGELLRAALDEGVRSVVVGVGNSATTDGGAGAAAALGAALYDEDGAPIRTPAGGDLRRLARVDPGAMDPRLAGVSITVACDVPNPLIGPEGSAAVFGPQKGASPEAVRRLERGLTTLVNRCAQAGVRADPAATGAGAAGGLAFGLATFCGAALAPGAALVLDAMDFDADLAPGALVLVGEGRLDAQSVSGKAPMEAARRAAARGCRVVALVGAVGEGWRGALREMGGPLEAVEVITPADMPLEEALRRGPELLEAAAERAVRSALAGAGAGGVARG